MFNSSYDIPKYFAISTSKTTQYLKITSIHSMPEPLMVFKALKYSPFNSCTYQHLATNIFECEIPRVFSRDHRRAYCLLVLVCELV